MKKEMKKQILKSIISAFIYAILLGICYFMEETDSKYDANNIFLLSLQPITIGLIFALPIFIAFQSFKFHRSLPHKGWRRILIILYITILPLSIYIGYDKYRHYWHEQIIAITASIIFSYIAIISISWLINWVKDGFMSAQYPNVCESDITIKLNKEIVEEFCKLCQWAYESWITYRTLFDDNPKIEELKKGSHKYFFYRLNIIMQEYSLQQFVKLHDPAIQKKYKNLSFKFIIKYGDWSKETSNKLKRLVKKMEKVMAKSIKDARNNVLAHNDLLIRR
ncbi:MAG: hypothetical protein KOO69_02910 [Victivallales bacterium]|nr:hypothetical protein [Victivallales bacterium]